MKVKVNALCHVLPNGKAVIALPQKGGVIVQGDNEQDAKSKFEHAILVHISATSNLALKNLAQKLIADPKTNLIKNKDKVTFAYHEDAR